MKKILLSLLFLCTSFLFVNAQCLSGAYTIGGTTPNFVSFNAAVSSLIANGVCGPVIFNVRPGTYNEQITIPQIVGTSLTKTITFQSETGDSSSVVFAYPSSPSILNNFVVFLNGCDHIRFEKMTIERTGGANYATVIDIRNNSDTVSFRRNLITNGTVLGAFVSLLTSNDVNDLKIIGNKFENGAFGISLSSSPKSIVIDSNTFVNHAEIAIDFSIPLDFKIRYNNLSNCKKAFKSGGGYGISEVVSNRINNMSYYGIEIDNYNVGYSYSLLIANNFISATGGIKLSRCTNAKVLFNSVYSTGIGIYCPYTQDAGNSEIFNNIFYSSTVVPALIFTDAYSNPVSTSNKNLFYSNGPNLISNYDGIQH
ncbi:MAG TPA: right-handed parallel beta-helix repeat-containing protein, partial [Bacteroidia bacterium]|nr:right-handed parallel beta-helix repeat-containing protein [Bacteroidia bacterium]